MTASVNRVSELVHAYTKLREDKAALQAKHELEIGNYDKIMELIIAELTSKMQVDGVTSLKTDYGTVYQAVKRTATCSDWGAFNKWAASNGRTDMFQRRLSKDVVLNFIQESAETPPGVEILSEVECKIRKN